MVALKSRSAGAWADALPKARAAGAWAAGVVHARSGGAWTQPGGGATATFGKTDPGTAAANNASANYERLTRYALPQAGSVQSISIYLDGASGVGTTQPLKAVLYTDAAGTPGALKATSNEVIITAGAPAGWVEFALPAPVALAAGNYWLGVFSGAGDVARYYRDGSGGASNFVARTYTSGPIDPYAGGTAATWAIAIYASYTPA